MASKQDKNPKIISSRATYSQLVLPVLFILAGVVLIGYAVSRNFSFTSKQQQVSAPVSQDPQFSKIKSINIPKIERDLHVEDGNLVDGRWEVSKEGVSYYTDSALPGQGGNTVLYGHNKALILGGLVDMKAGDKIELTLENGEIATYEVFETKTVKPTEVSILNATSNPQLTVYTCTGFLDSARFVVLAKPV